MYTDDLNYFLGQNEVRHYPRKRFSQNFLQDNLIVNNVISALHLTATDKVLEIGPGLGALTQPLLQQLNKLIAIEIDSDLQSYLRALPFSPEKLELILADALTADYSQWGEKLRILGNLPYNISTPLLLHLLQYVQWIEDMHFMLQEEVVMRLAAKPGTKDYGRLSVIVQYYCEVEHLFDVPPNAFFPKPKVDSAVVRLIPYKVSPYPQVERAAFERLVKQAFGMRRKTLVNNLKPLVDREGLVILSINPMARPEEITVMDYIRITNYLYPGIYGG